MVSLGSKSSMARHTIAYFLRKRVAFIAVLSLFLFTLFLLLQRALYDVDQWGLPQIDATSYIPFEVTWDLAASSPRTSLRPIIDLPTSCHEAHFSRGELCNQQVPSIDVLWTWVNGSDILLEEAKGLAQNQYASDDPYRPSASIMQARLYREHDELRHSMRSVLDNFRPYTSRFRLLTADFPMPSVVANESNITTPDSWRLGQIPQWLDLQRQSAPGVWQDGQIELSVTHHAQAFRPYNGTNFNSLAIESQFDHLANISEVFIYMNDDLFMMNPLSPVSFYTPAYGIVLHLQSNLLVKPERLFGKNQGEWRSLGESNFLLSQRFGARYRPYVAHEAKTASRALLHEMEMMWPGSFARTATHRFRETMAGDGDVNSMFMHSHFVVERAREALLWAWIVGRIGGLDDTWGEREGRQAWTELGGTWGENSLLVQSGHRETLVKKRVEQALKASGLKPQSLTSYAFSSLDGFPYSGLGINGAPSFLRFSPDVDEGQLPRCRISYDECFVVRDYEGNPNSTSDVLKNIAFRHTRCGDCVIMALVKASGPLGLSAFLPPPERSLVRDDHLSMESDVPHLPIVDDWQRGDFSLRAVAVTEQDINLRQWTLQLLQRYRYVIGDTPSMFERISTPRQTDLIIKRVEKNRNVALLCINDDVARQDDEVGRILKRWLDKRWKRIAAWERQ